MTQEELRNIIRTEIKEVMSEGELEDYKLPAQAERYLNKAVDAIKGANLNRKRQVAALARIVKALNLDKSDLIRYFAKIKRGL
jgi:predicted component of type VI protein secretion system